MGAETTAVVGSVVLLPFAVYLLSRMATKAYFYSKLEFVTKLKQKGM